MFEFDEFFRRMRRMFKEFDREFERGARADFERFSRVPGVRGIKIEIKDSGTGEPEVKVTRIGERPVGLEPLAPEIQKAERTHSGKEVRPPRKPIIQMLETNVGRIERPSEVVFTMHAPDVDKKDVETRQFGNAIEIIARKPSGEAYFGAFELPPDASPEELTMELKEGLLVVKVPRRRVSRL